MGQTKASPTIDPTKDGVDHINVWSKGSTLVGRLCSNFAHTPFVHPKYGRFESMEGFYYFIRSGAHDYNCARLHGFAAKEYGKTLPKVSVKGFHYIMRDGLRMKFMQNSHLRFLLKTTHLPLLHYYVYGKPPNCSIIVPKGNDWLVEGLERMRRILKENEMMETTDE